MRRTGPNPLVLALAAVAVTVAAVVLLLTHGPRDAAMLVAVVGVLAASYLVRHAVRTNLVYSRPDEPGRRGSDDLHQDRPAG